ncbi:unnamed protein product, partial [Coregonus sp. 'balchen']
MEQQINKSWDTSVLDHYQLISILESLAWALTLCGFRTISVTEFLEVYKVVPQASILGATIVYNGDIIYMHTAASTLKPIDAVFHCALRFITDDNFRTHHCVLYQKVGWASLY